MILWCVLAIGTACIMNIGECCSYLFSVCIRSLLLIVMKKFICHLGRKHQQPCYGPIPRLAVCSCRVGSLQKVQGQSRHDSTHRRPCGTCLLPIHNLVDLCDTQRAGKEIVKRPMFKSLQMTLCCCVACTHLTWKPHRACSLGTQVFYILDYINNNQGHLQNCSDVHRSFHNSFPVHCLSHRATALPDQLQECPTGPHVNSTSSGLWPCAALWSCTFCSDRPCALSLLHRQFHIGHRRLSMKVIFTNIFTH